MVLENGDSSLFSSEMLEGVTSRDNQYEYHRAGKVQTTYEVERS